MTFQPHESKYIKDLIQDIVSLADYATQDTTISGIIATENMYLVTGSGTYSGTVGSNEILEWRNDNYRSVLSQAKNLLGKVGIYTDDDEAWTTTTGSLELYDLVDGLIDQDGVEFTLTGTVTLLSTYPVDFRMRRATLYSDDSIDCYMSVSENGTDWTYWSSDSGHNINTDGSLIEHPDAATASGSYWSLVQGINTAAFPAKKSGKYIRTHLMPSVSGTGKLWQVDYQELTIATSVLAGPQAWSGSNYLMLGEIGGINTYEYDTVADAATYWTNDANAVDGSESTFAYRDTNTVAKETTKWIKGTAHDYATATGTINTVEVGIRAAATATIGKGSTTHYMVPVFGGSSDGDEHARTTVPTTPSWYWWDITTDTNAPGTWAWSDVSTLDVKNYVAQAVNPSPDWLGTWAKRIEITIDKDQFDSTLTWFPLMLRLGTSVGQSSQDVSAIFDEIADNQYKIAVTDSDQNQLYAEVEWWDGSGETATLHISKTGWSISSSVDTTIYIYYDSTKANNTTYIKALGDGGLIFDGDYESVHHMGTTVDSKYSDNLSGSTVAGDVVTPRGYGSDFEATDADEIDFNGFVATTALTVETWHKPESHVDNNVIVSKHGSDTTTAVADTLHRLFIDTNAAAFSLRGSFADIDLTGGTINNATWYYQAGSWSNATGRADLYLDGTSIANTTGKTGTVDAFTSFTTVGCAQEGDQGAASNFYDGVIDEVRISAVKRSDAWIEATYQTMNDNTNVFGAEEVYTDQTTAQHKIYGMKVKVNYTQAISTDKYIYTTDLLI